MAAKNNENRIFQSSPTLLIGLGGTGAETIRHIKHQLKNDPCIDNCCFLVVDTDSSSQDKDGNLPGFDTNEYCYLNIGNLRTVLDNLNQHQHFLERFDLGDKNVKRVFNRFVPDNRPRPGAGQIRPIGAAAFQANYSTFADALTTVNGKLTAITKRIKEELKKNNDDVKAETDNSIQIFIISSLCGGTGSSCFLDVAIAANKKIKNGKNNITGIFTLPSVYDNAVRKIVGNTARIRRNACAALTELDHIQTSYANSNNESIYLGNEEIDIGANIFNDVFLIENSNKNGNAFNKIEDIYRMMSIAIIPSINSKIGKGDAGKNINKGLTTDPQTKLSRFYASFAGTVLQIPKEKLLKYCIYNACSQFIDDVILGKNYKNNETFDEVDSWLRSQKMLEFDIENNPNDQIINELRKSTENDNPANGIAKNLYETIRGKKINYFDDKTFITKFITEKSKITNNLPKLSGKINRKSKTLIERYIISLDDKIKELQAESFNKASQFCNNLNYRLKLTKDQLNKQTKDNISVAKREIKKADQIIKSLNNSIFRGWRSSDSKQATCVRALSDYIKWNIEAGIRNEAIDIISTLLENKINPAIKTLDFRMKNIDSIQKEIEIKKVPYFFPDNLLESVTQGYALEFNLCTNDFVKKLYNENIDKFITESEKIINIEEFTFEVIREAAENYFQDIISNISILNLFKNKEKKKLNELKKIIKIANLQCEPFWNMTAPRIGMKMTEIPCIGIPNTQDDNNLASSIISELGDITKHDDSSRIYFLRKIYGARPNYLVSFNDMMEEYEEWAKDYYSENKNIEKPEPVHIFSKKVVKNMKSLVPTNVTEESKRFFALGMAYGFIAQRGANFYFNIIPNQDEKTYTIQTRSQWDCIPFDSKGKFKKDVQSGFHKLIDEKILYLGNKRMPVRETLLGNGREKAMEALANKNEYLKLLEILYGSLQEKAGQTTVKTDIENYRETLKNKLNNPRAKLFNQYQLEDEFIEKEINVLA